MAFVAAMCSFVHSSMHMRMSVIMMCIVCICMPWVMCMNIWNLFLLKLGFQSRMVKCTIAQCWAQIIYSIFKTWISFLLIVAWRVWQEWESTVFFLEMFFFLLKQIFFLKSCFLQKQFLFLFHQSDFIFQRFIFFTNII